MSEPKDKKKKKQEETQNLHRTDNPRVGDLLRHEREAQGMSLEDVCGSINIRTGQLRAIEDSNIDQLPGMIYATGFVRSYANFLKMDSVALVKRFKDEHAGFADHKPELHFPEPIAEESIPSSLVIGIGALCAVVILVGWAFFTGDKSDTPAIPEAPAVAADAGMPSSSSFFGGDDAVSAETPVEEPLTETTDAGTAFPSLTSQTTDVPAVMAPAVSDAAAPAPATVSEPSQSAEVASADAASVAPAAEEQKPVVETPPPVIEVKVPRTRVTLEATQSSWLQITDAKQKVIFKKVMKPGEKYSVPDQPGLSLITSNAGGLSVYVDGKKVNAIGGQGDIVRGVPLDPKALQSRRAKPQYN